MTTYQNTFIPSFIKAAMSGSRPVQLTFSQVSDTNIASTSSFMYDPAGSPLKSTQQLNVDWSQFVNHTFFMSAEAKVNIAFDQIINGFPFDGTRQETEFFFEKLTGFDKWVFDNFPIYKGELLFSGTQVGEDSNGTRGTFINVNDVAGGLFPDISSNNSGLSVLNPTTSSLSIEMQLFVPNCVTSGAQTVCQKLASPTLGFSLNLLPTVSTTQVIAQFSVMSGSSSMQVFYPLTKGKFNHLCVELNRETDVHYLEFFLEAVSVARSATNSSIGTMQIDASPFIIGSGTQVVAQGATILPTQTLSGVLDELRIFHSARTANQQLSFSAKSVFSTWDLALYYRFNEPPPPLAPTLSDVTNAIVLDSSGNSLHALISNFTSSLRLDATQDLFSNMIYEKDETCPVLFPAYPALVEFNTQLLTSASDYDTNNPNIITKLVPDHYLLEGAAQEGFTEPQGNAGQPYGGVGIPGQGQMGSVQIMLSLLYIWARFFDEMKLYVDSFSTIRTVNYDSIDTVPDNFLLQLVKQYGFYLPPMFNDSTIEQYIRAENIDSSIASVTSQNSIKLVQNELMRRVLVNMPGVLSSKGTQYAIKAFLRSVGIDPDNSMRIREYGGPTTRQLSFARETKRESNLMVNFASSSYVYPSSILVISPYLSSSRVEPGIPTPDGQFVYSPNGRAAGTTSKSDGLLTSGSWTWEGIVKFTPSNIRLMTSNAQSLARLCVTSSSGTGLVANLLAISGTNPSVDLFVRCGDSVGSPTLATSLSLSGMGVFDSDRWNVSFGVQRNDSIGSEVSSSYFIRVATQNNGEITNYYATSSFFQENPRGENNVFRKLNNISNASGSFLAVGGGQTITTGSLFLNNTSVNLEARITNFEGWLSNVRFWSKALTDTEWKEHVRNYKSTGVEDPLTNYNFVSIMSGSFERLRMDTMTKQDVRLANASASLGQIGSINFLDFSLNNNHLTGSGFYTAEECMVGELFDLSYLSPYFDEASTDQKIRVRSFLDQDNVDSVPWASVAPIYEITPSERPTDDVRFNIEFSLIDTLNRDIVTLFSTLDAMDNALGAPELIFSPDYVDLTNLRDIYFNRIGCKLSFQAFFEFYRWFDMSIGSFIEQLIPRKTVFKGTNFVVESHMLERHKLQYVYSDMYLGENIRQNINSNILLQEIDGTIVKF